MKRSLRLLGLVLICFWSNFSVQAQSVEELRSWDVDIDKVVKMHRLMKAYSWLKEFSGVVIVAKDEHTVFKYTGGYANLDYKVPNSLTTRYNLCNITQVFTAIAIMQLIEEGKISPDDSVKDYFGSSNAVTQVKTIFPDDKEDGSFDSSHATPQNDVINPDETEQEHLDLLKEAPKKGVITPDDEEQSYFDSLQPTPQSIGGNPDNVELQYSDSPLSKISKEITIHHLLTHTSGIKDYYKIQEYIGGFTLIQTIDDLLDMIMKQPREFPLGTKTQNSASNYVLLAKVVENITQMPFHQYIQEKIFKPIDMHNSGAYIWDKTVFNKATGYTFTQDGISIIAAHYWGAFPFGADALYSTSEDLLKFILAFRKNQVLSTESIQKMLEYGIPTVDSTMVRYGWHTKKINEKNVLLQNGSLKGLSVDLRNYEDDNYTIIVLSNYFEDKAIEIADRIEQVLYNDNYVVGSHPLGFFTNEMIKEHGIKYVVNNFDSILRQKDYKLENLWSLYSLGYDLMDAGKMKEAEEIFRINQSKFPNEPMVYDSMGSLYDKNGEYQLALQNFQKKLQMLPADKRAESMIAYLKNKIAKQ